MESSPRVPPRFTSPPVIGRSPSPSRRANHPLLYPETPDGFAGAFPSTTLPRQPRLGPSSPGEGPSPFSGTPSEENKIWNDKGSGADADGTCWRPVPPDGYVALGDGFASGHNAPGLQDVMCVAAELVGEGVVGDLIWDGAGSGADRDFGA